MDIIQIINQATADIPLPVNMQVQQIEERVVEVFTDAIPGTILKLPAITANLDSRLTVKIVDKSGTATASPITIIGTGTDILVTNDKDSIPGIDSDNGAAVITLIPSAKTWLVTHFTVPVIVP
jgi:hypothetical protein